MVLEDAGGGRCAGKALPRPTTYLKVAVATVTVTVTVTFASKRWEAVTKVSVRRLEALLTLMTSHIQAVSMMAGGWLQNSVVQGPDIQPRRGVRRYLSLHLRCRSIIIVGHAMLALCLRNGKASE